MPEKDRLVVYEAIANYSLNEEEPQLEGIANIVWSLIKPQLEANNKRYKNGKKGAKHGIKGGRPKTPKKPQENPNGVIDENSNLTPNKNNNKNVNDNVNVNVNDNVNDNVNEIVDLVFPFNSFEFMNAWNEWMDERKRKKTKPYTHRGAQGALHNLQKISGNNEQTAIEIINQSIIQGWQGLFPLKTQKNNESNTNNELARLLADKYKD